MRIQQGWNLRDYVHTLLTDQGINWVHLATDRQPTTSSIMKKIFKNMITNMMFGMF